MNATIQSYFDAFNAGDIEAMIACLSDNVAHHVNEGNIRVGKDAFREFCAHMSRCYRENLTDMVIFANSEGTRAAAEFIVNGTYLETDGDLPAAHGQNYRLPAGSFFSIEGDKITRVVTYYNLSDWIAQVK
jgi:steroid delta-isomerase-like uncharacterized protein